MYRCLRNSACDGRPPAIASWLVTAEAASVLNSAVPIDPPTCCIVLTIAEATPASLGCTPNVAVAIAELNTSPMPAPMTRIPGSTLVI